MTRSRRALSHWAWGYADRYADPDATVRLGQVLSAQLGVPLGDLREPVPADALELPAPVVGVPESLSHLASTEQLDRALHTRGRNFADVVRGHGGDFSTAPDIVLRPTDAQDVRRVLDWAGERGVSVVPFGGGSSVVGGIECPRSEETRGVVSLDLAHLTGVHELEAESRLARIGGGTLGPDLEAGLRPHGLTLRHYPQSFEHSTLGGWIATRAGGHFATVYTHIDDLVCALTMVTPAGTVETLRVPAEGAGPSARSLLIGSEGAFGVITEAWMRVFERPRWRARCSVGFRSFRDAVRACRDVAGAELHPANARLLGPGEAELNGVAFGGTSVLLLGFESACADMAPLLDAALDLARAHGGQPIDGPTVRGPEDASEGAGSGARWRRAFLDAPYLVGRLACLGAVVDTFETACTWARFEDLDADIRSSVTDAMKRVGGGGLLTRRFTHIYPEGPAPYYTFIAPGAHGSQVSQWREIKAEASEALLRHGAAITHHHAVGRVHRDWHGRQLSPPLAEALRAMKRSFDPAGVMNPGVLIDAQCTSPGGG